MTTAAHIEERIRTALPGADVSVEDFTGGGDHFRATIAAPQFVGRSLVEQHKLVYAAVEAELADGSIHALSLSTRALQPASEGAST